MSRIPRDFEARPAAERAALLAEAWCDACDQADRGLRDPTEFEQDGRVFLEGRCAACGATVCSEIMEEDGPPHAAD